MGVLNLPTHVCRRDRLSCPISREFLSDEAILVEEVCLCPTGCGLGFGFGFGTTKAPEGSTEPTEPTGYVWLRLQWRCHHHGNWAKNTKIPGIIRRA